MGGLGKEYDGEGEGRRVEEGRKKESREKGKERDATRLVFLPSQPPALPKLSQERLRPTLVTYLPNYVAAHSKEDRERLHSSVDKVARKSVDRAQLEVGRGRGTGVEGAGGRRGEGL